MGLGKKKRFERKIGDSFRRARFEAPALIISCWKVIKKLKGFGVD